MITREEWGTLTSAVGEAINNRLRQIESRSHQVTISGRDLPPPTVYNEVKTPEVHVNNVVAQPVNNVVADMAPVAEAIAQLGQTLVAMLGAFTAALGKLDEGLAALRALPAPTVSVNPQINVPVPSVSVAAPSVSVAAPNVTVKASVPEASPFGESRPKVYTVRHADGTESTISAG